MREFVLQRDKALSDNKQTLGVLTCPMKPDFKLFSLELAWKNNKTGISCIPLGRYEAIYTKSERISKLAKRDVYTYILLDVPKREGIRIHTANYHYQLRGCIALGRERIDLNKDRQVDIAHSGLALKEFEKLCNKEKIGITIIEV